MGLIGKFSRLLDYVFYRGERVGKGGRVFKIWKLRTMRYGAESIGPFSVADDDPRLTKIGGFLRKWKLDELPQIINVLKGDMALVGPRPEVKHYVDQLEPWEREIILSVKPGITDYASLANLTEGQILAEAEDAEWAYKHLIWPQKVKMQIEYVKNKSLWTDLKILGMTAWCLIRRIFS